MHDTPLYFPFTADHPVDQAAPIPIAPDQFGNGPIDARVFQFAGDDEPCFTCKHDVLAAHFDEHVGRARLDEHVDATISAFIAKRLVAEYPQRFAASELGGLSLEKLAALVPEDLAITRVRRDGDGAVAEDWLAAVHVCMPSGWSPRGMLGRSFAQVHRHVQVPSAKRFLLEHGKVKDYVGQMLACDSPHVRFTWSLQCGSARNRNPQTRDPAPPFEVDAHTGTTNAHFRVERQTLTSFADVDAALFTIRTYLYPLERVIADPTRRATLRNAVRAMPQRVLDYKHWDPRMLEFVRAM